MKKQDENERVNLDGLSDTSKRAIRSNMLEGILPDPVLVEDLRQFEQGKITLQQMKEKGLARILEKEVKCNEKNNHT
jgi:hypothetical protein